MRRMKNILKYGQAAQLIEDRMKPVDMRSKQHLSHAELNEISKQRIHEQLEKEKEKAKLHASRLYHFILNAKAKGIKKTPLKEALVKKGWPGNTVENYVQYIYRKETQKETFHIGQGVPKKKQPATEQSKYFKK